MTTEPKEPASSVKLPDSVLQYWREVAKAEGRTLIGQLSMILKQAMKGEGK